MDFTFGWFVTTLETNISDEIPLGFNLVISDIQPSVASVRSSLDALSSPDLSNWTQIALIFRMIVGVGCVQSLHIIDWTIRRAIGRANGNQRPSEELVSKEMKNL